MPEIRIAVKKVEEVLNRLDAISNPMLSIQEFVNTYFERLQKPGKSLKDLHNFLITNGIDVGTYDYFRMIYNGEKEKRARGSAAALKSQTEPTLLGKALENAKATPAPVSKTENISGKSLQEVQEKAPAKESVKTDEKAKNRELGLRPIFLADGKTEVIIDPNTGGKRFKI